MCTIETLTVKEQYLSYMDIAVVVTVVCSIIVTFFGNSTIALGSS
jgi:hypothetical protein